MKFSTEDVAEALNDLAGKGIVAELIRLDCRGFIGQRSHCPIAHYLADRFDVPKYKVEVNKENANIEGVDTVLMPPDVIQFVHDFDNAVYPNLIRPPY